MSRHTTKSASPDWASLQKTWSESDASFADLARRFGVNASTLASRARREGWRRGSGRSPDRLAAAEALYADLAMALQRSLAALNRGDPAGADDDAKARAALIRDHRKALAAVIDAQTHAQTHAQRRAAASGGAATSRECDDSGSAGLDLAAARREVMGRLSRLAAETGAEGVS